VADQYPNFKKKITQLNGISVGFETNNAMVAKPTQNIVKIFGQSCKKVAGG
jgi:hypothetical protein